LFGGGYIEEWFIKNLRLSKAKAYDKLYFEINQRSLCQIKI
jgi:hypothetical protein